MSDLHPALAMVEGRDPDADGFWTALSEHRLQVRRCTRCGVHFVLPIPSCPDCGGEPELIDDPGHGELYTWVVVRHAFDESLAGEVPYVVGSIELDGGGRVFGRVEGVDIDQLAPGLRLAATFPDEPGRPPLVFGPEEPQR